MATDEDLGGGANPSYRGYHYQKLVTVWVALELMFGSGAATEEVIVEPASHDDMKARLDVPGEQAEARLKVHGVDLHIQIKLKGSGHWSARDFAGIVDDAPGGGQRGPAPRDRAKALLLQDPKARYLFITNRSVDATLSRGRVSRPAARPSADFLPTNLKLGAADKVKLAGRFALIDNLTPEAVRTHIAGRLTGELHLPDHKVDAVLNELLQLVEDRLLGLADPLRRGEVLKVVARQGGSPYPDAQLATYVPPTARAEAERKLDSLGGVLLVGPSGFGKTLTARSLVHQHRTAPTPYEILTEADGLPAIQAALSRPGGRYLIYLDDPWGQAGLEREQAARWTKALPDLLRDASEARRVIVTSRTEVYHQALTSRPGAVWEDRRVVVDGAAYDIPARKAILHGKLKAHASWRQDFARQHEDRLVAELATPRELDGFVRQLVATGRPEDADIWALIGKAQEDGRRAVVLDQVRGHGDPGLNGAAVLWALLRQSRRVAPSRLTILRRRMERSGGIELALDDLAAALAPTQFDREADGTLSAHSKVLEALEILARDFYRQAERALNTAARTLLELAASDASWLDELQRVAEAAARLEGAGVVLDEAVRGAIDDRLLDVVLDASSSAHRFQGVWTSTTWRISQARPLGRLLHWLRVGAPKAGKPKGLDFGWRPPAITDAELAEVRAADGAARILQGFVAHILPWTSDNYEADALLPWLAPFGVELTEAFLAGCAVLASDPHYAMSADTVAEGALMGHDPPYDRVWSQVTAMDDAVDAYLTRTREERRAAWQGELDFAVQLHIQDDVEDIAASPAHLAKGYVRARRRREGFGWFADHPRPDLVLPLWSDVLLERHRPPRKDEIDAYFGAAGDDVGLRARGLRVIGEHRLKFGRARVIEALRAGPHEARDAGVRALRHLDGDAWETAALDLLAGLDVADLADLAQVLAAEGLYHKDKVAAAQRALARLSGEPAVIARLALSRILEADNTAVRADFRSLPPATAADLLARGPRGLARLLIVVAAAEGQDIQDLAAAWLASSDEYDALAALAALAEVKTSAARTIMARGLAHPDYKVRRQALNRLAPEADAGERAQLYLAEHDASAPVRERLAQVIGAHQWSDGLPVLIRLLADRRDYTAHPEHLRREELHFGVARAAAQALFAFKPLSPQPLDALLDFVEGGAQSSGDALLHARLIQVLATLDHERIWSLLGARLQDDRVVGGDGENLYPVRYSAAWAVVYRLHEAPTAFRHAPWPQIEAAAAHLDPQLAAPALIALGTRIACEGRISAPDLAVLRGAHSSDARRALVFLLASDPQAAQAMARQHQLLPDDHFLMARPATEDAWDLPDDGAWRDQLEAGTDVERVVRWLIGRWEARDTDFDPAALRRRDAIPIITTSEMFGME